MAGFGSNRRGVIPQGGRKDEIATFKSTNIITGSQDLLYDGSTLILTGNLSVEGSISASSHTSDGTTASNLGSGANTFAQKVNNELQFRSLVAGANVTINQRTNTVEVTASGGGAGNPAGNNTTVQYNDDELFNGSDLFTFDKSAELVTTPDITISGTCIVSGNIVPLNDTTWSLGSPSKRFTNIYTGDLHLRNERGNWTLYEEREMLVVINNITGKKYQIHLIPLKE